MERIKLFSGSPRRKLFSSEPITYNEGGVTLRKLKCYDCGREIESAAHPGSIICPCCGGRRFNVMSRIESPEVTPEKKSRRSLFGKEEILVEPENEYERKLKKFSGVVLDRDQFQKEFSDNLDSIFQKGYAEISDDGISISPDAYITERIFSKITVTVTKELDLDPDITEQRETFPEVIERLKDEVPHKTIILVKRAHNPGIQENMFSEVSDPENWVKDSRIIEDLSVEYYNTSMGIKQFMSILESRYPDAPDNILDILTKEGAIIISGNQVTISK